MTLVPAPALPFPIAQAPGLTVAGLCCTDGSAWSCWNGAEGVNPRLGADVVVRGLLLLEQKELLALGYVTD